MTKSILDELNLGDDASTGDPVDAIRQVASERGINPDHLIEFFSPSWFYMVGVKIGCPFCRI